MRSLLQCTVIFIFCFSIHARIIEHQTIQTIVNHLPDDKDTLIIFDIDHTLIQPKGWVGGPIWFEHLVKTIMHEQYISYQEAEKQAVHLFVKVHKDVEFVPVEPHTIEIVKKCQEHATKIIALTARSTVLAPLTYQILDTLGINFTEHTFISPTLYFHDQYHHHYGIVFCSGSCKGKTLVTLLQEHNYVPERVICIDDSIRHLHAIEKELEKAYPHIEFIGIRYSHLDYKYQEFDAAIAAQELATLLN